MGHVVSSKPMENDPLLIKNQMKDAAEKFIDWMPKFEAPKLNWFGG